MSKVTVMGNAPSTPGRIESNGRANGYRAEAVEPEAARTRHQEKRPTKSEVALWTAQNTRRGELIYKKMNVGLDANELIELAQLQEVARCYVDRIAPVPLDYIKEFEAEANRLLSRKPSSDTSV